jgi:hypothetical protein
MLLYIKVCAEDGHHSCFSLALCVCLLLLLLPQGVVASQAILLEQQAQLALSLAQHNPTVSDDSMTVAYMRLMSANGLRSCVQLLETALASGAVVCCCRPVQTIYSLVTPAAAAPAAWSRLHALNLQLLRSTCLLLIVLACWCLPTCSPYCGKQQQVLCSSWATVCALDQPR